MGKYGPQVQALLKKAASLEIQMLCPLHGPIWRENIGWFLDKYMHWSSYTPEESAVMIAYGSVYGNTEAAAFYWHPDWRNGASETCCCMTCP